MQLVSLTTSCDRSVYKSDYHGFSEEQRSASNIRKMMVDHNHEDHLTSLGVRFPLETQNQADFQDRSTRAQRGGVSSPRARTSLARPFAYLTSLRVTGSTQYESDCEMACNSSRFHREPSRNLAEKDTFSHCQGGVPRQYKRV